MIKRAAVLGTAMIAATATPAHAAPLSPAAAVAGHCNAWNSSNIRERDRLLRRVFAPDGVYSDPTPSYVTGRAALSRLITSFQHDYPGARFRCSAPEVHHHMMRVSWQLITREGKVLDGMDFYQTGPNGLIRRVTGFFGPPPALDPKR